MALQTMHGRWHHTTCVFYPIHTGVAFRAADEPRGCPERAPLRAFADAAEQNAEVALPRRPLLFTNTRARVYSCAPAGSRAQAWGLFCAVLGWQATIRGQLQCMHASNLRNACCCCTLQQRNCAHDELPEVAESYLRNQQCSNTTPYDSGIPCFVGAMPARFPLVCAAGAFSSACLSLLCLSASRTASASWY